MEEFLRIIASFPTMPLTVGLGVVVAYWLFALVTGADHSGAGADASADSVAGALKGAPEVFTTGAEGHVDGPSDASDAPEGGLLSLLGLGRVPVTIVFSLAALLGWTASALACLALAPVALLSQLAVLLGAIVSGLLGAALVLRPLGRALAASRPMRSRDALGHVCVITSGRVDASFGTATVEDGGAGLNLHVRCSQPNQLKKGDRAVLVDFDAKANTYELEPIDWLLPQELEALADPHRAAHILSTRIRRH